MVRLYKFIYIYTHFFKMYINNIYIYIDTTQCCRHPVIAKKTCLKQRALTHGGLKTLKYRHAFLNKTDRSHDRATAVEQRKPSPGEDGPPTHMPLFPCVRRRDAPSQVLRGVSRQDRVCSQFVLVFLLFCVLRW